MGKSIMQRTKECFLCRKEAAAADYYGELTDKGLHRHHVIFGKGYRSLSEKYGLWVYLCQEHHEGDTGVHKNKEINVELRQQAEREFLKNHSIEEWMQLFTRNYLEENEINRIKTEAENQSKAKNTVNKAIMDDSHSKNRMVTKEPPPGFWFIK